MQRLSLGGALLPAVALTMLAACQGDAPPSSDTTAPTAEADAVADLALAPFNLGRASSIAPGQACRASGYRRFDFWLGQWEIEDFAAGEPVDGGDDVITSELGGCVVFENYAGGGFVGRSMNTFDPSTGQWYQHWSDNSSLVLDLAGRPTTAGMLLEGDRPSGTGGTVHDRIEWTATSPGEVRQFWQFSTDGGEYAVQFDGHYHRRTAVTLDAEVPTTLCHSSAFPAPRQFDFTLGEWKVDVEGPLGGGNDDLRSTITTDLSGCLVEERLTGRHGYEARVFSNARRRTGQWFRTFADNRGLRVFLTGHEEGGNMVLEGTIPTGGAFATDVRVTWQRLAGGRFRQRWEVTGDGGVTWQRLLDATYRPR
jgi:hypothetical protein